LFNGHSQLVRTGWVYQWDDLYLSPDPPEDILIELYVKWKSSGVLDLLWYGEPVSVQFFLNWFSRPGTNTLGCYWKPEGKPHVVSGLCWINSTSQIGQFKRAEVGMGFLRHEPPSRLIRYGQMCCEWGFEHRGLECILGTTPIRNRVAAAYGKRIGFKVSGEVEGMCIWAGQLESVVIQSLAKERWMAGVSPFVEREEINGNDTDEKR
jgi:hypothetical protein